MSKRWSVAVVTLLGAVSLSPVVRADAVASPPATCPQGSVGDTSHNGAWCRPTTCNTDDDCAKNELRWGDDMRAKLTCREQALCVETRTEKSASGWSWGKPVTREFAHGECGSALSCAAPATCETVKRCVRRPPVISSGKCQCGAAGLSAGTDPLSAAPLLALLVIARRRGRGRYVPSIDPAERRRAPAKCRLIARASEVPLDAPPSGEH